MPKRIDIHVFLPPDLHAALLERASAEYRSISAEVIEALKAWLRDKQPAATP